MSDKFQNKYRIASARLQHWDYGWNAAYFVTICTKDREHYFGDVVDGKMKLSEIREMAYLFWAEIPKHFPFVALDAFVVMPNHVHGIIMIQKPDDPIMPLPTGPTVGQARFQKQGKHSLSSIIGSYKSAVTKSARPIHAYFAWQPRFHDHIIRNHEGHERISHYISTNPENWTTDIFY